MDEKTPNWLHYGWNSSTTHQDVSGWKNPKLTTLWMSLQHPTTRASLARKPQTAYIMDEPPASNLTEHQWMKKPQIEFLHGWTHIHPHKNYCMKKPNSVSSFMDEPPASTHQSTNGCKNPKLTMSRMNLQHLAHKNINGRKNPKLSSFNDEPPSDHKRITPWRNPKRS